MSPHKPGQEPVFPQFFTFHKINVPKNFELWSKDWLIYQILGLWKCGIELGSAQYSIDNYCSPVSGYRKQTRFYEK
jgi:hypothetical protein